MALVLVGIFTKGNKKIEYLVDNATDTEVYALYVDGKAAGRYPFSKSIKISEAKDTAYEIINDPNLYVAWSKEEEGKRIGN